MVEFFLQHVDMLQCVKTIGYLGITAIIFAETALFFGFFLPGDSLLFTAGLLAAKHIFNLFFLLPLMLGGAILGYALAYWFGLKLGAWLLKRRESFWFKKKYIFDAKVFYNKHGGKALVLGRMLPVIRTFVPIVAGMAELPYKIYSLYNVVGALIWIGGLTLLGYFLGEMVPDASRYLLLIVLLIIIISMLPTLWHYWQVRREQSAKESSKAKIIA